MSLWASGAPANVRGKLTGTFLALSNLDVSWFFPWSSIQSYSVLNDTTAEAQHLGQKFFDLAIPRAVAVQLVPGRIANQHDPTLGANFHIEVYYTMYRYVQYYSNLYHIYIYTYLYTLKSKKNNVHVLFSSPILEAVTSKLACRTKRHPKERRGK